MSHNRTSVSLNFNLSHYEEIVFRYMQLIYMLALLSMIEFIAITSVARTVRVLKNIEI